MEELLKIVGHCLKDSMLQAVRFSHSLKNETPLNDGHAAFYFS